MNDDPKVITLPVVRIERLSDSPDVEAALRWAMDEIDALSNKLTGFAYPQGMAMLDRAEQQPKYVEAVMARRASAQ